MPTPEIKKGFIIENREGYNALKALNYSGAKELLKSPAHYHYSLTAERKETTALRVGSLTHAMILEPHVVSKKFIISPAFDRRTKDGKTAYEEFLKESIGRTVVTEDEWDLSLSVSQSMAGIVSKLKVNFVATELMFVTEICGVTFKCAIDAIGDDGYIYDLKTAEDASPNGFLRAARNYHYNLQAYIYRMAYEMAFGERMQGFRFIVAEKEEPNLGACYQLGPEIMTSASFDFDKIVETYNKCSLLDEWPGYPDEVQTIDFGSKQTTESKSINFA